MVNQSWNSIRLCLHENRALEHLDSESYCLTEPVRYQSKCTVTPLIILLVKFRDNLSVMLLSVFPEIMALWRDLQNVSLCSSF